MGTVKRVGETAIDGNGNLLSVGQRVAVEPACPCGMCECCSEGNPNLCPNHTFYGVYPTDGALCEWMVVKSQNCFPIPDEVSNAGGALLETLGVAIHAVDLGKLKVARSVAVLGCGPAGFLIVKLAKLAEGSSPFVRLDKPVSAFFCLEDPAKAFAKNYNYEKGVQKIVVSVSRRHTVSSNSIPPGTGNR